GSSKWSAGPENWPNLPSQFIRTCCATPAATSSPTMESTPARCSTTWATATSCTRCDIPSCAPTASMGSGRTERAHVGRNRRHGRVPMALGGVAARFLWPPPSPQQQSKIGCKISNLANRRYVPRCPLAMRTYWLTLPRGIQSAPTVGDVAPRRPHQRDEALHRLAQGETQADIARSYAVDPATISRLVAASPFEHGAAVAPPSGHAQQGPSLRLHGASDAAPAQQRGRHDEYPLARRYRASVDGWS